MKRLLIEIGLLLTVLFAPFAPYASTVEKIVASVDGKAVTLYELDAAMKTYGPEIAKETGSSGNTLRAKVLDSLIDERLFENALAKSDVKVEPHEIDAYIDRILRSSRISMSTFESKLAEKKMTLDGYRAQIEKELLRNKFMNQQIGRKISISERELKDYYDGHMGDFKSASSVRLSQITIPFTQSMTTGDLEKVEKFASDIAGEAKSALNFEILAQKYNGRPYIVQGGDVGIVATGDIHPAIAAAVANLNVGGVTPPIVTESGVHIIRLTDRADTSVKDFPSAREDVYNTLYNAKMDEAIRGFVGQLRKTADIKIRGLGS